jgi:hypothetical protein
MCGKGGSSESDPVMGHGRMMSALRKMVAVCRDYGW